MTHSFWANKNKKPAPPVWWAGLVNRQQASSTRQIVGLLIALILLLGDEHMHVESVTRNMHSNIRDFGRVVKLNPQRNGKIIILSHRGHSVHGDVF
jgi:hypothetical protein